MAFQIIWSQTAVEDLKEIVQYIARDDAEAGARIAYHILRRVEAASQFPFSNRSVPEKAEGFIREAILRPYRIIYFVDDEHNAINILRIWHAARGVPDLS